MFIDKRDRLPIQLGVMNDYDVVAYTDETASGCFKDLGLTYTPTISAEELFLIDSDLEEFFEPIEEYCKLVFCEKKKKFEIEYMYWKHKKFNFILRIKSLELIGLYCNPKERNIALSILNDLFSPLEDLERVHLIIKSNYGFEFKGFTIESKPIDVPTMYNDDFIPVYDKLINTLTEETSGLVILHGATGTGKTNLIKHLTEKVKKPFIFVPNHMITYLSDPSFISTFDDEVERVFILEDCENYLESRESKDSPVVSSLLNFTNGIMSDIIRGQFICTFNADRKNIDKALLRKGRLSIEYQFNNLEEEKAKKLCEAHDLPFDGRDMSLAEIFNPEQNSFVTDNEKRSIGF